MADADTEAQQATGAGSGGIPPAAPAAPPVLHIPCGPDGKRPQFMLRGLGAAPNYTHGPCLIWQGRKTIDEIYYQREPVVVLAEWIEEKDLLDIEETRVRGYVLARGSATDPMFQTYWERNRATVMALGPNLLANVSRGDFLIVDGVNQWVIANPKEEIIAEYDVIRMAPRPSGAERLTMLAERCLMAMQEERAAAEGAPSEPVWPANPTPFDKIMRLAFGPIDNPKELMPFVQRQMARIAPRLPSVAPIGELGPARSPAIPSPTAEGQPSTPGGS